MNVSGTMNSATGHTSVSTRTGNFSDGLYDKAGARPDLDLDFARTKSLKDRVSKEDLITFSRSSTGTYVDNAGLVKEAPINYVTNHKLLHASYGTTSTDSIANPEGVVEDITYFSDISNHRNSGGGPGPGENVLYAASVYMKTDQGTASPTIDVNDKNTTQVTVTDQWQRFSVVQTVYGNTEYQQTFRFFDITSFGGSSAYGATFGAGGSSKIYVWGLQLEKYQVTDLIKTTGTINSVPRFTHDPETLESKGLLIEQEATNVIANKNADSTHWTKTGISISSTLRTAPTGVNEANELVATIGNTDTKQMYHTTSSSNISALKYTFSVFLKKGAVVDSNDVSKALIKIGQSGTKANATVDLTNGTIDVTTGTGAIENYGNGWYRASVTTAAALSASVACNSFVLVLKANGQNTYTGAGESIYFYGPQLEAGEITTSYIPTSGQANGVTRSPDIASIEGDNFGTYRLNQCKDSEPNALNFDETTVIAHAYDTVSPDGNFNASLLKEDTSNGSHLVRWDPIPSLEDSTNYTVSCHFKEPSINSRRYAGLTMHARAYVVFDLQTGTHVLTQGSSSQIVGGSETITAVGNGWYRCSATFPTKSTADGGQGNAVYAFLSDDGQTSGHSYTGDGTKGMYIWGYQCEKGNTLTPYIPSTDTYTNRQSDATFVDGNGIIRHSRANKLKHTRTLLQTWGAENLTVSASSEVTPDGDTTARKVTKNITLGYNFARYKHLNNNAGFVDVVHTTSVYVKADGLRYLHFRHGNAGGGFGTAFDLQEGTILAQGYRDNNILLATPISSAIEDAGNGWYRCSITSLLSDLTMWFGVSNHATVTNATDDVGGSMHFWHPQTVKGTEIIPFIPTDGTPAALARYSHDPETLTPTGLYLEPAATNLSENSEDFTHLSTQFTTLTQNAGTAPDGSNTAVKLSPDSNTAINRHIIEKNFMAVRDTTKTSTVWAKADPDGNGRYIQFGWAKPSGQSYHASTFDLQTGQITDQQNTGTTGGGGFLEATPYPNGWYRLRVTSTDTGGSSGFSKIGLAKYPTLAATQAAQPGNAALHGNQKFVGDAAEHSILIWGHQVESGEVATSYIPTSGATVTRAADTFTSTATEVLDRANGTKPAFYTKSGISFFTQGTYTKDTLARRFFEFKGNNASQFSLTSTSNLANPKMGLYQQNATLTDSSGNNYSSGLGASASAPAGNTTSDDKFAARFEFNNSRLFTNGTGGNLDQTCNLRSSTELYIGNWHNADPASHRFLGGTIQRLTFWKTPFVDSKLQKLTS